MLREDFQEAQMPVRGRKPKSLPVVNDPRPPESPDTTSPVNSQIETESEADSPHKPVKPVALDKPVEINKPDAQLRRSTRIKNKSLSSVEFCRQPWSANAREIQTLNEAISAKNHIPIYKPE